MQYRFRPDELERYAIAKHYKSVPESSGLCLHASVTLAQEARRLGLEGQVAFVHWCVCKDVNFLEHWALVRDNCTVLDMTAVQVDGNPYPLRRLESYPANYLRQRQYPPAIVLAVMERHTSGQGRNFSRRLLWALHRRLFRHDAGNAWRSCSPLTLIDTVAELARRGLTLCTGYLLELAIARLGRILIRLK